MRALNISIQSRRMLCLVAVIGSGFTTTIAINKDAQASQTCTPATNVEAIIDDSNSMQRNDPYLLRSEALQLVIDKIGNENLTLGAVEFGTDANTVFAPSNIGTNASAMKSALDTSILGDNLATDYNDGFTLASVSNPTADARIFLTDGGHNQGAYLDGHLGGPPTYVVGLGSSLSSGANYDRLAKIASDTGGILLTATDAAALQSAFNTIDAALNCNETVGSTTVPASSLDSTSDVATSPIAIKKSSKNLDATITWTNPGNQYRIKSAFFYSKKGRKKPLKLKVLKRKGDTYILLKLKRRNGHKLPAGTIKLKIQPTTLVAAEPLTVDITAVR